MLKVYEIIGIVVGATAVAALLCLVVGFPILWLWNWLMPAIFGLPTITYWQAIGLYSLALCLIKSPTISSSSKK